ncbi:MAG: DUF4962 domain-containing protein [bacterium]|nr:MAG: DUF4962 domain-containing protein [bacterium]
MKYLTLIFVSVVLLLGISFSAFAQQDTLSWSYVINQEWTKPAKLDSFVGVHPRMLFNSARVEILKTKISNTHKFIWDVVKGKVDSYLNSNPRNNPGDEGDTRADGDAIPWMALAYLITGDLKYLNKAVSWMITVCNYPEWDGNHSLGAGHCLMGVSLGYDWLYNSTTSSQRQTIRNRLSYFAPAMASGPQHKERYLSNHCQVEYAGLAAAGFALYDEVPEAENWLRQAYNIFNEAFQVCGKDGSSTEGHQYYGLMTEFQMHFNKMAKELLAKDFYEESEWLKNIGNFILYCTLPNFTSDRCVMRYGDTSENDYHGHGPTYQLFNVASEYRDPHFQWLALEMFDRGIGKTDRMGWANLLWYDETIVPTPPDNLQTFRHFEDTGWITSRSDWGSDAVMIGFKCGPFHGHAVQELYNNMAYFHQIVNGHGHPDVNHFNIYAYGAWLAKDDGYSKPKWTKYHNTILVNGHGQLGEGTTYFDRNSVFNAKATSRIIKAESDSLFDYIIGDAENIYKSASRLKKFLRHFIYIKPDFIIILDELKAEQPSKFEWLLSSSGSITKVAEKEYSIKYGNVVMDTHVLLPEIISDNNQSRLLNISPAENVTETSILVVMHIRKIDIPTVTVQLVSYTDSTINLEIRFKDEKKLITIDLVNQKVTVSKSTGIYEFDDNDLRELKSYRLFQNYPNPFNPTTMIQYKIPIADKVTLKIFDLLGREVRILVNENQPKGFYRVVWDGRNEMGQIVADGIYLYLISADDFVKTCKMILLK